MYEIWLALNILFELALANAGVVLGYVAILVVLALIASRAGPGAWRRGLPVAIAAGLVVAAGAFFALPSLSKSSLGEVAYWIDWANLAAMSTGFGGAVALLAWPLGTIVRGSRRGGC